MNLSLEPGNAPKLLAVRSVHATGSSGVAAGSFTVLDLDALPARISIAAPAPPLLCRN